MPHDARCRSAGSTRQGESSGRTPETIRPSSARRRLRSPRPAALQQGTPAPVQATPTDRCRCRTAGSKSSHRAAATSANIANAPLIITMKQNARRSSAVSRSGSCGRGASAETSTRSPSGPDAPGSHGCDTQRRRAGIAGATPASAPPLRSPRAGDDRDQQDHRELIQHVDDVGGLPAGTPRRISRRGAGRMPMGCSRNRPS